MVVDGARHTVESRPQINNPSDGSQSGTSANVFSAFLFLILSLPVSSNNAETSDNGQNTGLNQGAQLGVSALPIEAMEGASAPVSGSIGVQAENQQAALNTDLPITGSAQSNFGIASAQPLAAQTKPQQNDVAGSGLQSATSDDEVSPKQVPSESQPIDEVSPDRVPNESPAITTFVASLGSVGRPLARDDNAKPRDPSDIFEPPIIGNQPHSAQNPSPSVHLEQTAPTNEPPQADVAIMKPSEVVDRPEGVAHLQNTNLGLDLKKVKLFVAFEPPVGGMTKGSGPAAEEVRGRPEVQAGKERASGPTAADGIVNDFNADGGNDHLQNPVEFREEPKSYGGSSPAAKTSNVEFNSFIGDKTPRELPPMNRDGAQRSNEPLTFVIKPTVLHEAGPNAADVPATSWRPVVERVAKEMVGRIKLNQQDAMIQLDPPELGKIKIDLHIDGDKLQARIFTEVHESQSLIESHLQELRQALQANQLDLIDVRVQSWHGASGDAMHSFPQQHQQQTSGRQEWNWASGDRADEDAAEAQVSQALTYDRGRVSMWA